MENPLDGDLGGKQSKSYTYFTAAEWEARERPRQLLENVLNRQVENCETQRKANLKDLVSGLTPFERAAEIGPDQIRTPLMLKMENANLRQFWRITTLLMKVNRKAREATAHEDPAETGDVHEE